MESLVSIGLQIRSCRFKSLISCVIVDSVTNLHLYQQSSWSFELGISWLCCNHKFFGGFQSCITKSPFSDESWSHFTSTRLQVTDSRKTTFSPVYNVPKHNQKATFLCFLTKSAVTTSIRCPCAGLVILLCFCRNLCTIVVTFLAIIDVTYYFAYWLGLWLSWSSSSIRVTDGVDSLWVLLGPV